jgi:hypothetical protein
MNVNRGTSPKQGIYAIVMLCASAGLLPCAAQAATQNTKADATIVTPLSFIKDEDLDFGSVIRGTTAGTVVVPPTGARTVTGGVTLASSTFGPSRFAGFGSSGQTVQISVAANSITINRVGGGGSMTVDTFMIGSSPTWSAITTAPTSFTIGSSNGIFNFALGATLRVGASQAPGDYAGTFTVILNYQ